MIEDTAPRLGRKDLYRPTTPISHRSFFVLRIRSSAASPAEDRSRPFMFHQHEVYCVWRFAHIQARDSSSSVFSTTFCFRIPIVLSKPNAADVTTCVRPRIQSNVILTSCLLFLKGSVAHWAVNFFRSSVSSLLRTQGNERRKRRSHSTAIRGPLRKMRWNANLVCSASVLAFLFCKSSYFNPRAPVDIRRRKGISRVGGRMA